MSNLEVHFTNKSNEWETPRSLFKELDDEFNFTIDVCATKESAKCERFYTKQTNGLAQSWENEVAFMNPPYGREIGAWVEKAYRESLNGAVVVCLIPARTDTRYWHDYIFPNAEIRFLKGRVKFLNSGEEVEYIEQLGLFGEEKSEVVSSDGDMPAPFPSAVVIFK